MLDLERVRPNYEFDVELRYSYMNLQSHSEYLGDQRGVLGFDRLSTVGIGLELDAHVIC
ncbi:hypothetical protein D9M71_347880 [compost metagenome]